eukprot:g17663.t1
MPGTPEQIGILDTRQVWDTPDWSCGKAPPVLPPSEPAPGTVELPSIGSRGHSAGDCKPCKNGALCAFCHLCDRLEKKRRQKAKKMMYTAGA